MDNWLLAIVLKPFILLCMFVPVRMLTIALERHMRDSRLKRILFSPLPGHRQR